MNELTSELKTISQNTYNTFGKLSVEQINWQPNAESWSIGQCFEHLMITNNLYFPVVQKVVEGKHRNNFFSKIPFSVDLIAVLMKNSLNPEQKRKTKTFRIFEPQKSHISETIFDEFAENNRKLVDMINATENLDVHEIKIPEPLSIALNLRLDDAFEILTMHEKRHFQQAERVIKLENFPK